MTDTIETMHKRIRSALKNHRAEALSDFSHLFNKIGMPQEDACVLAQDITEILEDTRDLSAAEHYLYSMFARTQVSAKKPDSIVKTVNAMLSKRADLIFAQTYGYLADVKGSIIDFGTGDGQVAQRLSKAGLDVQGLDVRPYLAPGVAITLNIYDGKHTEFETGRFEAALITNVLHHEADNEQTLKELCRITRDKIVMIETVPVGNTPEEIEKDKERTFMNDYLYNRLLHNPQYNVPVPGTYETPQGWIDRIERYGFKNTVSENLGIDQELIRDTHHLLVFER